MKPVDKIEFEYIFDIPGKTGMHFHITLDPKTLNYIPDNHTQTASWAELGNEKCSNCPLNPAEHKYCPIALNLVNILPHFGDIYSYQQTTVTVITPGRSYVAEAPLQRGLGSMLGIYMVSSGCPIMAKLKPMVRYHLPFASIEETVFRAASTYLLGQYFKHKKGETADWSLTNLALVYEEVQKVNMAMAERLRSVPAKDANINALIVLDIFAKELPMNIEMSLKPLEYLSDEQ